ncbi:unnamed protein product, partial [Effrenium voratum]
DLAAFVKRAAGENNLFCARAMKCLARVLVCSGARVVLSSAWRSLPGGRQAVDMVFNKWGLPPVYSCTPGEGAERRVDHIWSWLAGHRGEVEGYAVVDDMDLSEAKDSAGFRTRSRIAAHFVRTPSHEGLTSGHVTRLLTKLQKEPALPQEGIGGLPGLPHSHRGTPGAMDVIDFSAERRAQPPHARRNSRRHLPRAVLGPHQVKRVMCAKVICPGWDVAPDGTRHKSHDFRSEQPKTEP